MDMQVLVAAVDKDVDALAGQMNLETEAVIVNQCDSFGYREYLHKGKKIRCFSMKERGVGLNRNTALMHAGREILLFSDEDIVFYPGYHRTVLKAFEENPDADIITFNFKVDPTRATYYNKEKRRIRWYNYGRYPTYAAAARRESLLKANVSFSLLFGGGARYSNGEDSLFFHDCLKKGLRLIASPVCIGQRKSDRRFTVSPPGSKGTTRSFLWTGVCCIIIFTVLWQGFFPCVSYMPTGGKC